MKIDSLLFRRDTLMLLTSSFTSFMGNSMHFVALSWFLLEQTNNPLFVGVLVSVGMLPGLLFGPVSGVLVDRYNKKNIAFSMDILRGILGLILALVCLMNFDKNILLSLIFLISFLMSIVGNFYFPAISGILKFLYKPEELPKVLSANGTLVQIGSIIGAAFSGLLISFSSISAVLFIDAITFLISGVCIFFLKYQESSQKVNKINEKSSILFEAKDGWLYVIKNKTIVFLFLIGLLPSATIYIINSILAIYTKESLNLGAFAYGILDSSFAVGAIIVGLGLVLIKKKLDQYSLMIQGYLFMAFGFFTISFSDNLILSCIGFGLLGFALMLINPNRRSILLSYVESNYVGRVSTFNWMFYSASGPLIGLFSTISYNVVDTQTIFLFFGVLSLLSYSLLKLPKFNVKILREKLN